MTGDNQYIVHFIALMSKHTHERNIHDPVELSKFPIN